MADEKNSVRIALSISSRGIPAEQKATYRAVQIAIKELQNDEEIPVDIGLDVFDDEGDTELTREYANEIVQDESIVSVVGPLGSTEALVNTPIFNEAGIAQITPCASHQDLCHEDNNTFFRLIASEEVQGSEFATVAWEALGLSNAAIVRADSSWAESLATFFSREYEAFGGSIDPVRTFPLGEPSYDDGYFTDITEDVVSADPDLVFCLVHTPEQGVPLSSELRARGVDTPLLGANALEKGIGGGEAVYQAHPGTDFQYDSHASDFRDAYVERYPADSAYSPEAYDAVHLIGTALRNADQTSRSAVLAEINDLEDYTGASGTVNFDQTGERENPLINFYRIHQTEDGRKREYLGTTKEFIQQTA